MEVGRHSGDLGSDWEEQAWAFDDDLILGLYKDNGKENGNYYSILGLYKDNGKENGNYCSIFTCRFLTSLGGSRV